VVKSAKQKIIENYYETTSARSGSGNTAYYERCASHLARRLQRWLPKDPECTVLDLGCGRGELLYLLEKRGFNNLTGVNLSKKELEQTRRYTKAAYYCQDILTFLHETKLTFDWIGVLNILEHLDRDTLLNVLQASAARLRPGGVIVAMVPNAISPFAAVTRFWDITHELSFTPNNFRQLAHLSGLSPRIEFRECSPKPHGLKSLIRWMGWQCIRGLIRSYLLIETGDSKGGIYTMDMLVRLHVAEDYAVGKCTTLS
jgi:SAM-dependent methyltransferase